MNKRFKQRDVLQDEASECGLACISYISGHFGKKMRLEQLRAQFDVTSDGLSFSHLIRICANSGLSGTAVKVSAETLGELDRPAILLWNNCHFVVLKRVHKNRIEVMDPAAGSRYFTMKEVAHLFSGFALEVSPSELFIADKEAISLHKEPARDHFFSRHVFLKGMVKYKSYMTPLVLLTIVVQLTNVAVPKFMSLVFDEVLPKNDEEFLWLLLYIFAFVYLVQASGSYIKIVLSQRLRRTISQREGISTVWRLFKMDFKFFNKRLPSDILRKIKSVDVFHTIYTSGWADIFIEGLFAVVFLILLFMVNFKLALLTLGITALMIAMRVLLLSRLKSYQYSALDAEIRRDNIMLQSIDNIIPIKINGSGHHKVNEWFKEHTELEVNRSSIESINALIHLSITTLSHIQTLLIMGWGGYSVLQGESTAGQLISFIFYKNCFISNIQSVVEKHVTLQLCSVEVKRLQDMTPAAPTLQTEYMTSVLQQREEIHSLELKDVSFAYSNLERNIITDVRLSLNVGQKLVIAGPSGCGKTTVLNIICGILQPTVGEMLVNGIELQRFGLSQYQQQISLVSPDGTLINGSVADNIIHESEHYDLRLLEQCIDDADLKEVMQSLSAGVNTRLGTNGARLSSGQLQRLLLARALYRRPRLILLDEPTSHLDRESALHIIELMKSISVCCVIVSHDPDVLAHFGEHLYITKDKY